MNKRIQKGNKGESLENRLTREPGEREEEQTITAEKAGDAGARESERSGERGSERQRETNKETRPIDTVRGEIASWGLRSQCRQ